MHEECGASLTSYTLCALIYDREKGHGTYLQFVTHVMAVRKYVQGTKKAVHSHKQLLVKNLYWSIQRYYLQVWSKLSGMGSALFQSTHLKR